VVAKVPMSNKLISHLSDFLVSRYGSGPSFNVIIEFLLETLNLAHFVGSIMDPIAKVFFLLAPVNGLVGYV